MTVEAKLRLTADGAQLTATARNARREVREIGGSAEAAAQQTTRALDSMEARAQRVRGAFVSVRGAVAALGLGVALRELTQYADGYANLQAKLRLATDGEAEYAAARRRTFEIAQETSQELGATVTLYGRLTAALEPLNVGQERTAQLTRTINQSLAVSGATTAESASAILQLSQAFGAGALRGEEFNAVNEAAPRLMKALADSMGVPRGALRELATEGKITADVMLAAFSGQRAAEIAAEFEVLPLTIERSMQRLRNAMTVTIGELDQRLGTSSGTAAAIDGLARNLGTVVELVLQLGGVAVAVFGGRFLSSVGQSIAAMGRKVVAAHAARSALIDMARGSEAAAAAAVQHATAATRDVQQTLAVVQAARAQELARLQAAQADVAAARATIAATEAMGAQSAALRANTLAHEQLAAAKARVTAVTTALASVSQAEAAVQRQVTAAVGGQIAAQEALALAQGRTAAAVAATTGILARLAAGAATLGRGLLALVGGPIGAVAVGLYALWAAFDYGKRQREEFEQGIRDATAALDDFNRASNAASLSALNAARPDQVMGALRQRADELREQIALIQGNLASPSSKGGIEIYAAQSAQLERLEARLQETEAALDGMNAKARDAITNFVDMAREGLGFGASQQTIAANTSAFTKSLEEQIEKMREEVIERTKGTKALLEYQARKALARGEDAQIPAELQAQIAAAAQLRGQLDALSATKKRDAAESKEQRERLRESAKALRETGEAVRDFERLQNQLAEQLEGHSAEAARDYAEGLEIIEELERKLLNLGPPSIEMAEALAQARSDLSDVHERRADAIARENDIVGRTLEDLAQETRLIGMTTQQRQLEVIVLNAEREARQRNMGTQRQGLGLTAEETQRLREHAAAMIAQAEAAENAQRTREIVTQGFYAAGQAMADFATRNIKSFRDLFKAWGDIAKRAIADVIAEILRLRIIEPFLRNLFAGGGGGGGWMGALMGMFGARGSSGGGGAATAGGGGFNWMSILGMAGGGNGGTGGLLSQGGTLARMGSSVFGVGTHGAVNASAMQSYGVLRTPTGTSGALGPLGTAAAGLGGAYYGYQRSGNIAGAVGYGALGIGLAGTAAGLAGGATLGAAAGGAFSAFGAAAAIPVVGWILAALAFIDLASGGKLFGTKFKPEHLTQTIGIGAEGAYAQQNLQEVRNRSMFRGRQWRDTIQPGSEEAQQAAQELFKQVGESMKRAATALGVELPPMIEASFNVRDYFDKKGKVKAEKREEYSIVNGVRYNENQEAFQQRVGAEALIAVVSEFDAAADGIAQQWRANAAQLLEGATFLLAASIDIKNGFAIIDGGLEATLELTEELALGNETLSQTYVRLAQQNQLLRDAFVQLGVAMNKTPEQLTRFADEFVNAAGGQERASGLWTNYFQRYYSAEERAQFNVTSARENATERLTSIGLSASTTPEQFRQLFEQQLPTLSGEALAKWLEAADALGVMIDAEDELNAIRNQSAREAQARAQAEAEREREAAEARAQTLEELRWEDHLAGLNEYDRQLAETNRRFDEIAEGLEGVKGAEQQLAEVRELQARAIARLADKERERQQQLERERQQEIDAARSISAGEQVMHQVNRLAEIMARVAQALGSSNNSIEAQAEALREEWRALFEEAVGLGANEGQLTLIRTGANAEIRALLERERERLLSLNQESNAIRDWLDAQRLSQTSTLNPQQRAQEADRQFQANLDRARGGDTASRQRITQLADAALAEQMAFLGQASSEYRAYEAQIRAAVEPFALIDSNTEVAAALNRLAAIMERVEAGTFFGFASLVATPTPPPITPPGPGDGSGVVPTYDASGRPSLPPWVLRMIELEEERNRPIAKGLDAPALALLKDIKASIDAGASKTSVALERMGYFIDRSRTV